MALVFSAKGATAFSSAGVGALAATMAATAQASVTANGSGSFAGVLTAKVTAMTNMWGTGSLNASDTPGSTVNFHGVGQFGGVGYAFYSDAEVAGPREEIRVFYVPYEDRNPVTLIDYVEPEERTITLHSENRVAVVPAEDRVYEATGKPVAVSPPNRRRTL
jgi:hypothetical protein